MSSTSYICLHNRGLSSCKQNVCTLIRLLSIEQSDLGLRIFQNLVDGVYITADYFTRPMPASGVLLPADCLCKQFEP